MAHVIAKGLTVIAAAAACGCSIEQSGDCASCATARSALTQADTRVLGFEARADWSATSGVLTSSDVRVEGNWSLAVSSINSYTVLRSVGLSAPVTGTFRVRLMLPTQQPNPWWAGGLDLFLDCPSRGIHNAWVGHRDLSVGLPLGTFNAIDFAVPNSIVNALSGQTYADLNIRLALNVPSGPQTYRFDQAEFVGAPRQTDFTIAYIQREPIIPFVVGAADPTREGWPAVGDSVTWRGTIKNYAGTASTAIGYRWYWDDQLVGSGSVSVPPNGTATAAYVRPWNFERHQLKLVIDPDNAVAEEEELNNELSVYSNALSVGWYVEQGSIDFFYEHQRKLAGAHSNGFENWAQRQMAVWNQIFQAAVFPDTPNGVLDRVRLDKIVVVPNGTLPIDGGDPNMQPNRGDHTIDLEYGFPYGGGDPFSDKVTASLSNPFYFDGGVLHESLHGRYVVDDYAQNVVSIPGDPAGSYDKIFVQENGVYVVGTPLLPPDGPSPYMLPDNNVLMYRTHFPGVMETYLTPSLSLYSAMALNQIAGQRPKYSNYNGGAGNHFYLADLPLQNRVTLVDAATGARLAGANVRVYRSVPPPPPADAFYAKMIDDTPDISAVANSQGQVLLGPNPFSDSYELVGGTYGVFLLRIEHQARVRYQFMEVGDFNIEYWRGHTALADYQLDVQFP